jgi:predicted transcriptional regulator/transcriptional regulator with XRE-family HTH domain
MMKQRRRIEAKAEATGANQLDSLGLRLQNIRQLQNTTQLSLAKELGIGQTALSHMEGRDDILLSSLKTYVEALGGQLNVAATSPNAEAVSLVSDSHRHLQEQPSVAAEPADHDQLSLPNVLGPAQLPPPSRDVIFSIRPVHAEKILDGSKTVELRRRFTGGVRPGTLALIYSTSPTSALTGSARIKEVERLTVLDLWEKHCSSACLYKREFEDYFSGVDSGYAIVLTSAKPLVRPVGLPELRQRFGFEPPQSYQYVRPHMRALVM